jgi:hypothetical protein
MLYKFQAIFPPNIGYLLKKIPDAVCTVFELLMMGGGTA